MGVTIHFRGQLKNKSYAALINVARSLALANEWLTEPIQERERKLLRVDENEKDFDYIGPTKGVILYPHEDCEPVRLEFDRDLCIQEYTKTQFAGPEVHIQVVELLRQLQPHFQRLVVEDEGEYWETSDEARLRGHLSVVSNVIEEYRQKDPRNEVKVREANGRITDLINYYKEESGM